MKMDAASREANIRNALGAIEVGNCSTIRAAAKEFDIPYQILVKRWDNHHLGDVPLPERKFPPPADQKKNDDKNAQGKS